MVVNWAMDIKPSVKILICNKKLGLLLGLQNEEREFGQGRCDLIANFSATVVTSFLSFSVCFSLSLSLSLLRS